MAELVRNVNDGGLLDLRDKAARLEATLQRVALALGGLDEDGDDLVALAYSRMQEIAVYERETERQLHAGIDTLQNQS